MFCKKIQLQIPFNEWVIKHHMSYSNLVNSAGGGCKLCRLFKAILLEQYSIALSCSLGEAKRFHFQVDNEDSSGEADRQQFFVEPYHEELDTRTAPFEEGLKSLLFLRHTDEDDDPLKEVCPQVSVRLSSGSCKVEKGIINLTLIIQMHGQRTRLFQVLWGKKPMRTQISRLPNNG
jgi:hypothetical protein